MCKPNQLKFGTAVLLLAFAGACSDNGNSAQLAVGPEVESTVPLDQANAVPLNAGVRATFTEAMDSTTVTPTTFTLSNAQGDQVATTIVYANRTAVLWPTEHLEAKETYVATVTTGVRNAAGANLRQNRTWRFTTGNQAGPVEAVDLATAGDFVILAKSAISTVPMSDITGDLGIGPAAASSVTGFGLTLDASNQFATSTQVNGSVFAADHFPPTPARLGTAVLDMESAFADASARAPDVTELGAGDIGGRTLTPGVYHWNSGLSIPTGVTLAGSATDVWILQIDRDLHVNSGVSVNLTGGARPQNVFWRVGGLADLGTTSSVPGNILTATSITLRTGAQVNGRLMAQTAVDLDGNVVVEPNL